MLNTTTSSNPMDIGHIKDIVLDARTKRFTIENGHSRSNSKGPFAKNLDGRSFSDLFYSVQIGIKKRAFVVRLYYKKRTIADRTGF